MPRETLAVRERLLTDRGVADVLGVSRTTARRLRYDGALPPVHVGALARVRETDLAAYAAQGGGAA